MKQTAVEWLFDAVYKDMSYPELLGLIAQAKEMEKEQIKNEREEAYNNGYANGQKDAYTN